MKVFHQQNRKISNVLQKFLLVICFVYVSGYSYSEIKVFFNSPVFGDNLRDVVINYINQSQDNISMSAYSFDEPDIANALLNAAQRGVKIRIIIDSDYWNSIIDILDSHSNINIFNDLKTKGYKNNSRQHHSKFIIIDYNSLVSPVKNTVITGSFNFTSSSSLLQYNNVLVIENDVDVANIYIQEFNEEWGSSGFEFNQELSRFGKQKTDPPPYFHSSGDVEVYFSYSDKNKIKDRLSQLFQQSSNMFFCMYSFSTNSELFDVVYQSIPSKSIFGVFDEGQSGGSFSAFPYLIEKDQNAFVLDKEQRILHNKYIILNYDESYPENSIVITGSYNISKNSEENNEENVIIIKNNPIIAKKFIRDFLYHFSMSGKDILLLSFPTVYPTNMILPQGTTNVIYGKNLNKVVSLFISNDSTYLPLTIISNYTNSIVFSSPIVIGTFSLIALLQNGDIEVTPVNLSFFSSSEPLLIVNDGNKFINLDSPINIILYSLETTPITYLDIILNGNIYKIFLNKKDNYFTSTIFIDTLTTNITNLTPIIFKYSNTLVTNYLLLPPFMYKIIKPDKIFKNSFTKIKFDILSTFNRKLKLSANGNVPLNVSDDGTISFFTGNEDKIKIFFTIEDNIGYSFSDYIEIDTDIKEEIVVYPTIVNKGDMIFIDGNFDRIDIFDKDYNRVSFSIGEDETNRKYILPDVLRNPNILFLIFYNGNKKFVKKVIVK